MIARRRHAVQSDPTARWPSAAVLRGRFFAPARWHRVNSSHGAGFIRPAALTDPAGADWPMSLEELVQLCSSLCIPQLFLSSLAFVHGPKLAAEFMIRVRICTSRAVPSSAADHDFSGPGTQILGKLFPQQLQQKLRIVRSVSACALAWS